MDKDDEKNLEYYKIYKDDPLLTADMLWDYFYIDGHDGLSGQVLSVLDRIQFISEQIRKCIIHLSAACCIVHSR